MFYTDIEELKDPVRILIIMKLQISMGQLLVEGGKPQENLSRAVGMIANASIKGSDIIVLPECCDIGWTNPKADKLSQPIPGDNSDFLCRSACEYNIYIVAGLTERDKDKIYNTALLISPKGKILLKHRKINILSIAQDIYSIGDRLMVTETPIGKVGLNICADNFPNSLVFGHSLARMGAQIILSPCAWAVKANHDNGRNPYGKMWKDSFGSLARLYEIYVVGVSNVGWIKGGPWDGRKCIGCSLLIGPEGNVIKKGSYGVDAEELITVNIELMKNSVIGTEIATMLNKKGYLGP